MTGRIFVIDDDLAMCDIIQDTLEEYDYSVDCVYSIAQGQEYLTNGKTELIIFVLCAIFLHEDSKKVFDSSHSNFNVELNAIEHQLDSGDIDGVKGGL